MSQSPYRTAIITGAGTGIGAAVARRLAADGLAVVLAGRRLEPLDEVAALIRKEGGDALAIPADVADPQTPARLVNETLSRLGRIDVIVNNAAYIRTHPLADFPVDEFDQHVATNLRGPFLLIQQALPALRASPNAAVVNISSSSGTIVRPEQSVYGMTKAGLEYLTRSLAAELAPDRIRVNCVAPGPVDTPIHETWAESREAAHAWMLPQIPLARIGDPEDIAVWVSRFCQEDSAWVTGAVIPVDGGQSLDFQ